MSQDLLNASHVILGTLILLGTTAGTWGGGQYLAIPRAKRWSGWWILALEVGALIGAPPILKELAYGGIMDFDGAFGLLLGTVSLDVGLIAGTLIAGVMSRPITTH